jgi:hypothetical protein
MNAADREHAETASPVDQFVDQETVLVHNILILLDELHDAGGDGGIRTLDRALQPYNGLANRRLQPLGHISAVINQSLSNTTFALLSNWHQFWHPVCPRTAFRLCAGPRLTASDAWPKLSSLCFSVVSHLVV